MLKPLNRLKTQLSKYFHLKVLSERPSQPPSLLLKLNSTPDTPLLLKESTRSGLERELLGKKTNKINQF